MHETCPTSSERTSFTMRHKVRAFNRGDSGRSESCFIIARMRRRNAHCQSGSERRSGGSKWSRLAWFVRYAGARLCYGRESTPKWARTVREMEWWCTTLRPGDSTRTQLRRWKTKARVDELACSAPPCRALRLKVNCCILMVYLRCGTYISARDVFSGALCAKSTAYYE